MGRKIQCTCIHTYTEVKIVDMLVVLLLAVIFQSVTANDALCPPGWFFAANSSSCYTLTTQYMTYSEAVNYCQSVGGSQAFISTSRDFPFITSLSATSLAQPWLATT
uniref:C-type lectin domain-containing protein n=1 Tax=Caenorhabditis japonica TaxID=281687 RepID=A0A8R1ERR5_CAEJA